MTQEDIIQTILKDSNYHLSLFSDYEIAALSNKIVIKESKSQKAPFVTCIIRSKDIQLKPEEVVRQLYVIREYIRAVREDALRSCGIIEPGSKLDIWLEWANHHADRIDPLVDD